MWVCGGFKDGPAGYKPAVRHQALLFFNQGTIFFSSDLLHTAFAPAWCPSFSNVSGSLLLSFVPVLTFAKMPWALYIRSDILACRSLLRLTQLCRLCFGFIFLLPLTPLRHSQHFFELFWGVPARNVAPPSLAKLLTCISESAGPAVSIFLYSSINWKRKGVKPAAPSPLTTHGSTSELM